MRRLILASLAFASLATPVIASAYPGELRDDRRDVRQERQELREAQRYGDRRDVREQRRDVRDARQELREDRRDRFQAGRYDYPRGQSYRAWDRGAYVPRAYWGQRYWIGNPGAYRLGFARPGTRWVRVGPDALLILTRNGAVIDVVRNRFY